MKKRGATEVTVAGAKAARIQAVLGGSAFDEMKELKVRPQLLPRCCARRLPAVRAPAA